MASENVSQLFLASQMQAIIDGLSKALQNCASDRYSLPLPMLSGATIGEHTRHIVEFFQCVSNAFETDEVDYAIRARNRQIETDKEYALQVLKEVTVHLSIPNKPILLCLGKYGEESVSISSNFYREIAYNIEHAIHHMAFIKIGLKSLQIQVDDDFGVAPSTLQYRAVCAS